MVLRLARVLDVPLRERNALLLAAGFAPAYVESKMEAPALELVRHALDAILRQQEPFPAVVMNRYWDIVRANDASTRSFGFLLGERACSAPTNMLRGISDPRFKKGGSAVQLLLDGDDAGDAAGHQVQEIRIERFFPADAATERAARRS